MAPSAAQAVHSVRCEISYDVPNAAVVVLQVAVAGGEGFQLDEQLDVVSAGSAGAATELAAGTATAGAVEPVGRQHLVEARPGRLTVSYAATVVSPEPAAAPVTTAQLVTALRPSRYCPSDRLAGFAGSNFGRYPGSLDRVRAIQAYLGEHLTYASGSSGVHTDAVGTLLSGAGVCRDFAHLMVALCRAVEVPARVVACYAPGLSPMDFHLVVETGIDGVWRLWDATGLAPRASLVRIATGRDAADVAFSTVLSGQAELSRMEVVAVVDGDLPVDDQRALVSLP